MGNQQGVQPSKVGEDSYYKMYKIEMQRNPVSELPPYRHTEIAYLKKVFEDLDKNKTKTIQLQNLDNYYALMEHPLYERIRVLFREQIQKIKVKKITFEVFHIETEIQKKYQYLFRLYDFDQDFKLGVNDLMQTFEILFGASIYNSEVYGFMAESVINKEGTQGYLRIEDLIKMVSEDEVKQLMTLKFLNI